MKSQLSAVRRRLKQSLSCSGKVFDCLPGRFKGMLKEEKWTIFINANRNNLTRSIQACQSQKSKVLC